MRHIELAADGVIAAVKSHVAGALSPFVARLDALINQHTVVGPRYNAQNSSEVDTETF